MEKINTNFCRLICYALFTVSNFNEKMLRVRKTLELGHVASFAVLKCPHCIERTTGKKRHFLRHLPTQHRRRPIFLLAFFRF